MLWCVLACGVKPRNEQKGRNSIMWNQYDVVMEFDGPFAASLPRTPEEIRAMLEHRMPGRKPEDAVPIEDLAVFVEAEVGISVAVAEGAKPDEWQPGWATFKRDDNGLYYEGRCVRGHLKDCATVMAQGVLSNIHNFRSKFVNRVYVFDRVIPVMRDGAQVKEPDGSIERFVQAITARGPRSSIKYIDYVDSPTLSFTVSLLAEEKAEGRKGGEIGVAQLRTVFEYGGLHGMGQERSQDWGRYSATVTWARVIGH